MMINPSLPPFMPDSGRHDGDKEINEVTREGRHEDDESDEKDIFYMVPPGFKIPYTELYQAVLKDDLIEAKSLIFYWNNISGDTSTLYRYQIALSVAVSTSRSINTVKGLLNLRPKNYSLKCKDLFTGDTVLHEAAIAGNTKAAEILVKEEPKLALKKNQDGDIPLYVAALYDHQATVHCLLHGVTYELPTPFLGTNGARLLNILILGDFYDSALHVLKNFPKLALEEEDDGGTALDVLAEKTRAFASGYSLRYWERLLYQCISALRWSSRGSSSSSSTTASVRRDVEKQVDDSGVVVKEAEELGILKRIENKIMVQKQAMELLKLLVEKASKLNPADAEDLLVQPLHVAAKNGIHEIVTEIIVAKPTLTNRCDIVGHNLFHIAVTRRQEQVFNLLYQMSSIKQRALLQTDDEGNNLLHLTASSEPSNKISGAALKMQRELQWFQAVEEVLPPSFKEKKNKDKKTPRELFTETHKDLVKDGEKWMKKTADACTIVAALIVTVAFAAAFTSPGGNKQDEGTPVYLWKKSFVIFAVADALALFFSSTSLLMFLGILTSRYSERDFLYSLPKKMSVGLITLFLSMAAMLVGFCSSMYLVLFHRGNWIVAPIAAVACVPVMVFAFLQFPLLVELVLFTFGPSIFRKRSNKLII